MIHWPAKYMSNVSENINRTMYFKRFLTILNYDMIRLFAQNQQILLPANFDLPPYVKQCNQADSGTILVW